MKVQELVNDMRSRFSTAGKPYQDAFKAYVTAQKKALIVVTRNGQSLAGTEIGAAKNLFAAARASFDRARADGVREVAKNPQTYVPNGRDQIVSAYKDTIGVLRKTGNELGDVVSNGYKSVLGKLNSEAADSGQSAATAKRSTTTKTASAQSTAKRKTAASRKSASSAKSTSAAKKTGTPRKRASSKTSTSGDSAS